VDDTNGPSLIKLSGSATNCRISNVRFVNAPHFGVCINGAANVTIRGCTFEGGPVSAAGGQLQAVFFIGANSLCIKNNHFRPGVGNGKMHQWIGAGSTTHSNYVTISGNTFESSFNCSANMSGVSHSNITGNISKDACAVAFQIISGVGNVIANNTIDNAAGGGFCLAGAQRCIVSGNVLNQVGFIGIEISPYGGDLGSYTNNLIIKNSIKGAASGTVYEGIRVYSAGGTVSGTRVDDNTITGMGLSSGRAAISLQAGAASYSCVVTSNIIDQCGNGGIEFIRINRSMYAHNVTAVVTGKTCFTESYVTEANTKTDNIEKVY
jgi:parallel beta-helix repeat protein